MSTEWTPETNIEILFKKTNNILYYAKSVLKVMFDKRITRTVLNIITNMGWFNISIHDWRKNLEATKTWQKFKTVIIGAYKELSPIKKPGPKASESATYSPMKESP